MITKILVLITAIACNSYGVEIENLTEQLARNNGRNPTIVYNEINNSISLNDAYISEISKSKIDSEREKLITECIAHYYAFIFPYESIRAIVMGKQEFVNIANQYAIMQDKKLEVNISEDEMKVLQKRHEELMSTFHSLNLNGMLYNDVVAMMTKCGYIHIGPAKFSNISDIPPERYKRLKGMGKSDIDILMNIGFMEIQREDGRKKYFLDYNVNNNLIVVE